ncbi:MAG: right-handed parallel beta-helix repeat-containing protein [Phycisphaerae bacterium]|nr:right-handed parallel beta-helix repeat-containing protein [Phycisphaerae bacterium]
MWLPMVVVTSVAAANETLHVPSDHPTIQAAIDIAVDGDIVAVAPGIYPEAIDLRGKAIVVKSTLGAQFTVIDASGLAASGVKCASGEGPATVIDGFTVTGGSGDPSVFGTRLGGGMFIFKSSPTVLDCTFVGNEAAGGGGLCNFGSASTISGCRFIDNTASFSDGGGGMANVGSSPTVTNCVFRGNDSGFDGGGMHNLGGSPSIVNCAFLGNTAQIGAGMRNSGASPTIINCTFADNVAFFGGGIRSSSGGTVQVTNCILWGNEPDQILELAGATTVVAHSTVQDGWDTGSVVLVDDPRFVDPASGNYRLADDSPCIDSGDPRSYEGPDVDLDGNPRLHRTADAGALGPGLMTVGAVVDLGPWENPDPTGARP